MDKRKFLKAEFFKLFADKKLEIASKKLETFPEVVGRMRAARRKDYENLKWFLAFAWILSRVRK